LPEITTVTRAQRQVIRERARGRCEYCQSPIGFSTEPFTAEHIHPRSRGGPTTLDNLALACTGCNGHKGVKIQAPDPESDAMVPLFHPRQQRWIEHFRWSENTTRIIGLTPTGRATIDALQLNRAGLVNLRRIMLLADEHPPHDTLNQNS
jgi:hypothetical protein